MLDRDLAELYGVQTRVLNQAVRRNTRRFPQDFMFALTAGEFEILISQFVTSSWGGIRKPPLAFTELGISMLSSVLNSETAIDVNIQIIRIFNRMRELIATNKDILLKIEEMEKNFLKHDARLTKGEADIRLIFEALKRLLTPPKEPRPPRRLPPKQRKRLALTPIRRSIYLTSRSVKRTTENRQQNLVS